ncbi:MFS transporter [Paenibacillus xylanexedens]|uniref:MFS transporter n=1 Tax=Paenibacillus xylanexedens TaxID=528191 RepID=UPI0021B4B7C1|nr:MFS transporter [Paenibacillus xylanexedens]
MNVEGAALERSTKKTFLPALHASFSAGTLIGVGIGSIAIILDIPIFTHIIAVCSILLITLYCVIDHLPSHTGKIKHTAGESTSQPKVNLFKDTRLLFVGIIVMGMALAEGAANDWIPILFVDGYNVTHLAGSIFYGIFLSAMLIGRIMGGNLLDHFGRVPVLAISSLLAIVGLSIVIFNTNPYWGSISVFCWGIGASLGFPVGLSAAGDNPNGATERVAFVSTLGYLAFLVGPPVIGILGESYGLLKSMLIVLVAVFIAGIFAPSAKKQS